RGSAKARLLLRCGYRPDAWQVLEADLRLQHLTADAYLEKNNSYGRRFEIRAPVTTPNGQSVILNSVWQIDVGTDTPRFITMFPR
ncbi:MAG TPA: hypothetical protein VKB78_02005, partial [Pirellulales bacterium]|nr:hypothetical protein [Pirellulales bacterium]